MNTIKSALNTLKMEMTDEYEKKYQLAKDRFYEEKEQKFLMRVTHLKHQYNQSGND